MSRVAVVTGATGSIGTAITRQLGADGWTVISGDIAPPEYAIDHPHYVPLDVTSDDSVRELFQQATRLGELGALVCNQGILKRATAGSYDGELVQQTLDVNLKGTLRLLNAATDHLADNGAVVQISSVTASTGAIQGSYVYQATKAGIEQLTRFFAVALGPRGIRVNCVAPGMMAQAMRGDGLSVRTAQGNSAPGRRSNPLGRPVEANEVAEAVTFLCSSRASGISGVVLPVDCGFLAS